MLDGWNSHFYDFRRHLYVPVNFVTQKQDVLYLQILRNRNEWLLLQKA